MRLGSAGGRAAEGASILCLLRQVPHPFALSEVEMHAPRLRRGRPLAFDFAQAEREWGRLGIVCA
ncbi:hypothetical protein BSZ14_13535 [Sphingomonas sp. Sph1(2015)]|nr:hypothetical protein BSZ14_13535 [Sphingomonas sp. Sph1(2015)]